MNGVTITLTHEQYYLLQQALRISREDRTVEKMMERTRQADYACRLSEARRCLGMSTAPQFFFYDCKQEDVVVSMPYYQPGPE